MRRPVALDTVYRKTYRLQTGLKTGRVRPEFKEYEHESRE
jgi:hypothetical protein